MSHPLPTLPADATARHAIACLRSLTKQIGVGFHPDTPGSEYVTGRSPGRRSFDDAVADELDATVSHCLSLVAATGRDPYATPFRVQRRMIRRARDA